MEHQLFWIGILPVLAFVVVESITTRRNALYTAIIFALVELFFTLIKYHTIDQLTLFSFIIVLIFAILSIKKDNDIYFKLQPAILGIFFGISFFVFYYILDKPIMNYMFDKYFSDSVENLLNGKISLDRFHIIMKLVSRDFGWWFIGHSLITAFAAFRLSKWMWFFVRVPGFYLLMFLAMFITIKTSGV